MRQATFLSDHEHVDMPDLSENIIRVRRDEPIHRVFPLLRAAQLFQTGSLALVRPSSWDDPFENAFLNAVATEGSESISLSPIRDGWYGQCWTSGEESDAMWRIYSPEKNAVRVSTTVGKLFDAVSGSLNKWILLQFFIGAVEYLTEDALHTFLSSTSFADLALGGQNDRFAETLLLKRTAFEHEKEVRVLFCDVHKKYQGPAVVLPIDTDALIDQLVLDPRLDDGMIPVVTQMLRTCGAQAPITRSTLYQAPKVTIRLS